MRFYIVDAFTDTLFGGNPAGVVILDDNADFPLEDRMKKTAAELRYSETAFVKPLGDGRFHTRYFTPTDEVDLCGHATIAAFTVLKAERLATPRMDANGNPFFMNRTLAGDLVIGLEENRVMMDMGAPQNLGAIQGEESMDRLFEVMGLKRETIVATDAAGKQVNLEPMIISTGLPDIMMPVSSPEMLSWMNPDFEALSRLSASYQVTGVHAFAIAPPQEAVTAYCRNFAPLYGIPEEAATGTSNGALTYYLYLNGLVEDGDRQRFVQGREMGRPSLIESSMELKDAAPFVRVGGTGVILAKGSIFI